MAEVNIAVYSRELLNKYMGYNRNTNKGLWDAKANRFYFIRYKWGETRMDSSVHPEDDDDYALFYPFEFICNNE